MGKEHRSWGNRAAWFERKSFLSIEVIPGVDTNNMLEWGVIRLKKHSFKMIISFQICLQYY
jgi:hypothetical protein